ncbi:trehalose permease IIC protein [Tetragenococcus osmophilus]|uniref:PTS system trehalose-specific EIIBC component n=1 Tax=Tetragenococcus osmophilus TaxID=526944 RepID=A0AA37XMJ2_9ENTE|nr:PTS transporter subunit EIIC [Tetragenococcus osmophilus]AYW47324.1 trehalose permease IIC protein [Tetragenococcus osmophilus]GMA52862.1 PTS system trehalose-specific EIIBC component [Alicyclobacillus contaminans]GMA73143.1 PTS system trehalose-specific EIIBC component [Tetragenococcus osmophilus]
MNYQEEAKLIVQYVGGKENIAALTHCVTRLRFVLYDEKKVSKDLLEELEDVKSTFVANGQFQVVIGPKVETIYNEVIKETDLASMTKEEVKETATEVNLNPLQRVVKILGDVFVPILPAIVTAGLLMGIGNLLTNPGIFFEQSLIEVYPQIADLADMIGLIANTSFQFLPALITWSTVKYFKGNPLLGIVLGLVFVHPDLMNAWDYGQAVVSGEIPHWTIFGLSISKMGLQAQVLPALVSGFVLAKTEIFLKKRIPETIQLLVVAPVAILFTSILTFILIAPITISIGDVLVKGIVWLFQSVPFLGGLAYGVGLAPLIVTGMHHAFLPIHIQLMANGGDYIWPIGVMNSLAQGSAAIAMYFLIKDKKLKGVGLVAGLSAYMGITEPAMFGVNLKYKFPFVISMITSGVIGGFMAAQHIIATSVGISGLPGFLSIPFEFWPKFFICMILSCLISFAATYFYGRFKIER